MKQTAVEWLVKQLNINGTVIPMAIEYKAKEIEKEQIKDAYEKGKKYKKPIKDSNPIWLNSKPYKNTDQ
jgi:hypothetical protein